MAYDTTPAGNPVVTVTSDSDGQTATGPVTYSFKLSEPVSDLTADSVTVTGGSKGALVQDSTDPLVYHMVVTPDGSKGGTVTATIASGSLHDLAGNPTLSDATDTVAYDTTPAGNPTLSVTSTHDGVAATNTPVTFGFIASEPLKGFSADNIEVTGGTKGELTSSPDHPLMYFLTVTPNPNSSGEISIKVPAGAVFDMAGNPNLSSVNDTVLYDTIPPTVTISDDSNGKTVNGAVHYTFTASETLLAFAADNIEVTGGTKGDLVQDSSNPLVYHMTVTPNSDSGGSIDVKIPAGSVHDLAGNPTVSDVSDTVAYDTTNIDRPVVTITSDSDGQTVIGPVTYNFKLSQAVNDFTADSVTVTGGSKGQLVQDSSDPLLYHMVVTPDANQTGNVTATIPSGQLHNIIGLSNLGNSTDSIAFDTAPPTIAITSTGDNTTTTEGTITYTFTLSEPLKNFTADDINVYGGTKGSLIQDSSNPLSYSLVVTPNPNSGGVLVVNIPAGSVQDVNGNPMVVNSTNTVGYVIQPDDVRVFSAQDGTTVTGDITYYVAFNNSNPEFSPNDLTIENGTLKSFERTSNNSGGTNAVYTIVVTPAADNVGINSLSISPDVTNGFGVITGTVPFDTRQLNLQDYTDTGASATDYISQDNSFTLSLDNAANGTTPSYQISKDNGTTWTDTSATQSNLPDGHYLYRAVRSDIHDMPLYSDPPLYSNVIDLTVDTTKPDLISINPTNGQAISGIAEAGTTVNLLSNDGQTVLGTVVADSNNHWSISGLNIADGTPIKATATDTAGNVSSVVTTRVDATPPAVTVDNSNGTTITGTTEAGAVVKVDTNGDGVADYTEVAGSDGKWSVRPDTPLANGTSVSVTSTDPVGNVSAAATTVVDNVAPVVTLTTADNQTLTGTVDDPTVTSVKVFDNTGNFVGTGTVTNGNYSLTLADPVAPGTVLTAKATDPAGNVGSSSSLTIGSVSSDSDNSSLATHQAAITAIATDTLPTSAVSTVQNNDFDTRDPTLTVSGTSNLEPMQEIAIASFMDVPLAMSLTSSDASGSTFSDVLQISTDGQNWSSVTPSANGAWTWTDPTAHDSNFTYYLRTLDSSGQVVYTTSKDITIDLIAPSSLVMPTWNDAGITVTKDADATVALINDVNHDGVYEQGVDKVLAVADNSGTTATLSATLTAGQHYNLGLVQYDVAGNYSRLSNTVSYTAPPTSALNTAFQASVLPPQEVRDSAGMAVGFDAYGNLNILQRSSLITQSNSTNYALSDVQQLPYLVRYTNQSTDSRNTINSSTIVDYNRDGYSDVLASDYIDSATTGVAVWTGSQSGYSLTRATSSNNSAGGVMAYDKDGDGYVDAVLGNWGPQNGSTNGTFIKNTNGVLSQDGTNGTAGLQNFQFEREVSGVDLKGDGNIDVAAHTISNSASSNQYALALIDNNGGTLSLGQNIDNVFNSRGIPTGTTGQKALPSVWGAQSMVWADFANNGHMDLYLSQGGNTPSGSDNTDSRIYMNNNGVLSSTPTIIADDNLAGGAAIATDWNHDGKMDVIEIRTAIENNVTNIPVTLLTNNGVNSNGTLNPFTVSNMTTIPRANITGIAATDVNWDGAVDLLYSTASGSDTQADKAGKTTEGNIYSIMNTNAVADGTSLHLKILDQNGVNSYFGNTVQLFDSDGNLVSTQIINPQEGMWNNDSSGIVNFYNLDPNQHYSVALVRATDGHSNDIGGRDSYGQFFTLSSVEDSSSVSDGSSETGAASALNRVENVEKSWNNLTPGAANHAYVLEGDTTATHTVGGVFTGTGYDDTFFAGAGNNSYIGGGGWGYNSAGEYVWMSSGGHNVVDYSGESSAITVNMGNAVGIGTVSVSKTDGHDSLQSIQGIVGTNYDDSFTSDGKGDYFEGGGGNDTFNLAKGGHDTLMYKLLDNSDNTGGNGSDTVNDFHLGNTVNNPDADIINIKDLLADYQGTANVFYDVTENKFVMDKASSGLDQFVSTSVHNGNTTISVDRDGANGNHQMTALVTLDNTQTDLATLIGNHQLIIA
ncbi:Ig-like domain-containing protein [Zymomonas mobilis]|uniref:Ig-like domain-containing protein n=1 Tax=Zymomonas mobilis TaxID=542 RepID=UPI0039EC188D